MTSPLWWRWSTRADDCHQGLETRHVPTRRLGCHGRHYRGGGGGRQGLTTRRRSANSWRLRGCCPALPDDLGAITHGAGAQRGQESGYSGPNTWYQKDIIVCGCAGWQGRRTRRDRGWRPVECLAAACRALQQPEGFARGVAATENMHVRGWLAVQKPAGLQCAADRMAERVSHCSWQHCCCCA